MLLNFSNHPQKEWTEEQLNMAIELYGTVADLPFPQVSPSANTNDILLMAEKIVQKITKEYNPAHLTVHIMGEMTLAYTIVYLLQSKNINCIASTSRRNVAVDKAGNKIVKFDFVKFRAYPKL